MVSAALVLGEADAPLLLHMSWMLQVSANPELPEIQCTVYGTWQHVKHGALYQLSTA